MKVVIDIPEEDYKDLMNEEWISALNDYQLMIRNGKPLPKGHGDLIDANELINDIVEYSTNLGGVMAVKTECIKVLFEIATIVIPADK